MSELLGQIEQTILTRRLLRRGEAILVAVSGGLDSMVLLHVLNGLATKNGWRLAVAHLNHQLRGRSSSADERLVLRTAKRLGLPAMSERADVRSFAKRNRLSIEMAARRLRHDFLARTAAQMKISKVALAHHADDQIELFFLRLLRGSGGEGLAGMKWRNGSPINPKTELIRPLLDQPKSALREYAVEERIPFREDATNSSLEIQRNRIRHELLPLLRKNYQPALDKTILRAMRIAGAEADFVAEASSLWLESTEIRKKAEAQTRHSTRFADLAVAVQRRCVQGQLLKLGVEADFDLVEALRMNADRPVSVRNNGSGVEQSRRAGSADKHVCELPGMGPGEGDVCAHRAVFRDGEGILHIVEAVRPGFRPTALEIDIKEGAGEATFGGATIRWQLLRGGSIPAVRRIDSEFFDADRVGGRILLRHWQPGDRFQPIGMALPVKLQDLFTNQKILRDRRHELIVAATALGELFWVEGLRISERFKLTRQSIRRLRWRWRRS